MSLQPIPLLLNHKLRHLRLVLLVDHVALGADDGAAFDGGFEAVDAVHELVLVQVLGEEGVQVGDVREEELAVSGRKLPDGLDVPDVRVLVLGGHQAVEDGLVDGLGAEVVQDLGEVLGVEGPSPVDVRHAQAGEFPAFDEAVETVERGRFAEHPRKGLVKVVAGGLQVLGQVDVAHQAQAALGLERDAVDGGPAGLQVSLEHRLQLAVASTDLERGDFIDEDGVVALEIAELLGGAVVEHPGAGGAAAAQQPDILAQVGIHERLASALGTQLDHVQPGLHEDEKPGDELELAAERLGGAGFAEAVGVVLHRRDEQVHPFLRREFAPGAEEIGIVDGIGLEGAVGGHVDEAFFPAHGLHVFQGDVPPVLTVHQVVLVVLQDAGQDERVGAEVRLGDPEPSLAVLEVALDGEPAGQVDRLPVQQLPADLAAVDAHLGLQVFVDAFQVDDALLVGEPLDDVVFDERGKISSGEYAVGLLVFQDGQFGKDFLDFFADRTHVNDVVLERFVDFHAGHGFHFRRWGRFGRRNRLDGLRGGIGPSKQGVVLEQRAFFNGLGASASRLVATNVQRPFLSLGRQDCSAHPRGREGGGKGTGELVPADNAFLRGGFQAPREGGVESGFFLPTDDGLLSAGRHDKAVLEPEFGIEAPAGIPAGPGNGRPVPFHQTIRRENPHPLEFRLEGGIAVLVDDLDSRPTLQGHHIGIGVAGIAFPEPEQAPAIDAQPELHPEREMLLACRRNGLRP